MGARGLPDIGGVRVPDSRAAVEAEQLCRQESSPMLYAHALRSYYFAALLGKRDGLGTVFEHPGGGRVVLMNTAGI